MAKLVPCKACEKEIAKGVKKCPNCGKDQRNWFRRHKILTFFGVIILIGILSSLGGGEESDTSDTASNSKTDSDTKATAKKEKVYKVNDAVVIDKKSEVVLTDVEETDKVGDQYLNKKVSDGGTFVAVHVTVKNVSDKPIGPFSTPTFKLVDEKGTDYSADIDATSYYAVQTDIDNSKLASDLNPNIKVTDVQVFEISKDAYAKGKWYLEVSGKEKIQVK